MLHQSELALTESGVPILPTGGIGRNLVTFRLSEQTYALPIRPIVRIIEMVTITPVPQLDSAVQGVINFQGQTVSVINLRRHLGMADAPLQLRTPIVLVRTRDQVVGLIVDQVLDVLDLADDQIARPQALLPKELSNVPFLYGVAHTREGVVFILNPDQMFSPRQARALNGAVDALAKETPDQETKEHRSNGQKDAV